MFLRKINWFTVKDMITALPQLVFRHARNVYSIQLMAQAPQSPPEESYSFPNPLSRAEEFY